MKPVGIESLPESVLTGAPDLLTGLLNSSSTPYGTPLAFVNTQTPNIKTYNEGDSDGLDYY
jgi:hypothetical protein